MEADTGSGFELVAALGEFTTEEIVARPEIGSLIDGNDPANRVSYDTGPVDVDIPVGATLRTRWISTSSSRRLIFGFDNLSMQFAFEGDANVDGQFVSEGDPCPACEGGELYEKTPRVLVRIVGQAPLGATVYRLQKLRCHLCGKVFTASEPEEAGTTKYDATAASMIGLLKYGTGLPFNRLGGLPRSCKIPLPASTQWQVLYAVTPQILPAYEALIREAAQGEVLHNDDTTVKIMELMKECAEHNLSEDSDQRTGIFTSGVIATRADCRIALFFSGRQHAGENLNDVLQQRAAELTAPIQMSDGLSRYTCELCDANALEYLTELQRHADDVAANPQQWMPWNYSNAMTGTTAAT